MRALVLLIGISTAVIAQDRPPEPQPDSMVATVRAVGSSRSVPITIAMQGALFHSLGITGGAGTLSLNGDGGTATGFIAAEFSRQAGALTFSSPRNGPELEIVVGPRSGATVPVLRARGHVVTVVRTGSGPLSVRTGL